MGAPPDWAIELSYPVGGRSLHFQYDHTSGKSETLEFRDGSHCSCLVGKRSFTASVICAGTKCCGNPVIQEFRKMETRLLWLHRLALDKEHPHQPAFPERVVEHLKSEIRNEHQQHDQVAGERFL